MQGMRTPTLTNMVAECWERAEQALQGAIRQKYPDRDEEEITMLLRGELDEEFSRVSKNGTVERAFFLDLSRSLPDVSQADLSKITRGPIATVHFHPRKVEERTGGDFGLVFTRPNIRRVTHSRSRLTIDSDYQRGLLCQAKVFGRGSAWGKLSAIQRKLLRDRLSYLVLLLYRYTDQDGERRQLEPFSWQETRDAGMEEISGWLKSDTFPKRTGSRQIITELAQGAIGTDDKKIISDHIAPEVRPSLKITVGWPEGHGPGREVQLAQSTVRMQMRQVQSS